MRIGEDYPKIEWEFAGLNLLEPNAVIGDTVIFIVSLYCYYRIQKSHPFYKNWSLFYLFLGSSFLTGGLGHLLFDYFGLLGKSFSWLLGIVATYYVEQAMLVFWPKEQQRMRFKQVSKIKMGAFLAFEIMLLLSMKADQDAALGLLLPTVNSILGLGLCLGGVAYYYHRNIHRDFRFFWYGSLVLLPNAVIQGLKLNLDRWFDRNDLSHSLFIFGILLYYLGLKKLSKLKDYLPIDTGRERLDTNRLVS